MTLAPMQPEIKVYLLWYLLPSVESDVACGQKLGMSGVRLVPSTAGKQRSWYLSLIQSLLQSVWRSYNS